MALGSTRRRASRLNLVDPPPLNFRGCLAFKALKTEERGEQNQAAATCRELASQSNGTEDKKAEGRVTPRSGDTEEKFQGPGEDFFLELDQTDQSGPGRSAPTQGWSSGPLFPRGNDAGTHGRPLSRFPLAANIDFLRSPTSCCQAWASLSWTPTPRPTLPRYDPAGTCAHTCTYV